MKGIRLSGVSLSGMVVLFLVCLASWTEPSLAKDQLVATAPAGIPSGRIAFVSDRDGNYEIYVMSSDGSDQRRLTYNTAGDDNSPAWSPDGTKIAFVRGYGQGSIELRVMDSELGDPDNGSSALLWSDSRGVGYPRWSPDGSKVLFTAKQDEYWVASDGSGTALQLTQSGGSDSWADWSPDGKTIAFASTGDLYGDCAQTYLYLMDADGENARPILDGAGERILGGCNGLRW